MRRLGAVLTFCLLAVACDRPVDSPARGSGKAVVLGFDGVDPDLVREWIDVLPNIRELSRSGTLMALGTTNPPESPVAWASFSTGMNPGRHGIFDFLRRDPSTYFPDIGLVEVKRARFLFGWIPISRPEITNNRKGLSYWKHLDANGIPTINLRMPLEFPAELLKLGKTWSGLSVPDVRGTWGTYFYFASDLTQWDLKDTEFGGRLVKLDFGPDNRALADLDGPIDPRRGSYARISIPVEVVRAVDGETPVVIRIQGQEEALKQGQWSGWFRFRFDIGPFITINGASRFYVLETFPETRLYLMPISIDPEFPAIPISQPDDFTSRAVQEFGVFKTLGWIHETWGLNEEQIDEGVFLEDLFRNMENLRKILLSELDRQEHRAYSAVFTATDSVSHMFFRLMDPAHPRYDTDLAARYGTGVRQVYERMDSIIGEVRSRLGPEDLLLVVSDHGFHSWRKEFNTNTWLVRDGYMVLRAAETDSQSPKKLDDMFSGGSFFPNVDWSQTRAYSLGLGHIYVNLKGRESQGIVEPGREYDDLVAEIRQKIILYRDPDTGESVIHGTYFRDDIYHGEQMEHAGDIQLTFRSGYRTSWQTALGAVPESIVVANLKKWSGDHCASDFSDTQGFLVSNRKIITPDPTIMDVAPTLYRFFSVPQPAEVDGKPFEW